MITAFTYIMLALGAGVVIASLVYIVGFVISAIISAGYVTVESVVHRGHDRHMHTA